MAKRKINGEQENEVSKDSKRQSRIKRHCETYAILWILRAKLRKNSSASVMYSQMKGKSVDSVDSV